MKIHGFWKWSLGIGISLLLAVQLIVLLWLNPIVERVIQETIALGSDKHYCVSQVRAEVRLLQREVWVRDLVLEPDTLFWQPDSTDSLDFFRLEVPLLTLKNLDFRRAIEERVLDIGKILLETPYVEWVRPAWRLQPEKSFRASLPRAPGDLFPLISGRFNGLYIGFCEIRHGQLYFRDREASRQNTFFARDISLSVTDFALEASTFAQIGRPFAAQNFSLNLDLRDYSWVLPDSTYKLNALSLGYAHDKQVISLEGLEIQPFLDRHLADPLTGTTQKPIVAARIPLLSIGGMDAIRAFFDREVEIQRLRLEQAQLRILQGAQQARQQLTEIPDLYPFIAPYIKTLVIDSLELEDIGLSVFQSLSDTTASFEVDQLDTRIARVRIDPLAFSRQQTIPYAEQMELSFKNYRGLVRNNEYLIKGDSASFSSQTQRLTLSGAGLVPLGLAKQDLVRAHLPFAELKGMSATDILARGSWKMDTLRLLNPEIRLINFPQRRNLYFSSLPHTAIPEIITRFFHDLAVEDLLLEGGSFHFNATQDEAHSSFAASDMTISIQGFALNDLTRLKAQESFQADRIFLEFGVEDYSFLLPDSSYEVSMASLWVSSADSVIRGDSVRLLPVRLEEIDTLRYELFLPAFSLTGIDFNQAYFDRVIRVDSILFDQPELLQTAYDPRQDRPPLPNLIELDLYAYLGPQILTLDIGHFEIRDAAISQRQIRKAHTYFRNIPHIDLSLQDFYIDSLTRMGPDNLFYAQDLAWRVRDVNMMMPDSIHRLKARQLLFSSGRQSLHLDMLTLTPEAEDSSKVMWEVTIPQLELEDLELFNFFDSREADLSQITIRNPRVNLVGPFGKLRFKKDSLPGLDPMDFIKPYVRSLTIDAFDLRGGSLTLKDLNGFFQPLSAKDLRVGIQALEMDPLKKSKPFYADDIILNLDVNRYALTLPDSSYEIAFRKLGFSTRDSILVADSLQLTALKTRPGQQVAINAWVPRLQVEGVSPLDLYTQEILDLKKVKLERPYIFVRSLAKGRGARLWRFGDLLQEDPYPALSKYFRRILVDEVAMEKATLHIGTHGDRPPWLIDSLFLYAYQVKLDSLSFVQQGERYSLASDLAMEVRNYEVPLPDSAMYRLTLGKLGMDTRDQTLILDSIRLDPKYDKASFAAQKGHVVDRFSLLVPQVRAVGVDHKGWVENGSFDAKALVLCRPRLSVFKDKRYPFPTKTPPMPIEALLDLQPDLAIDTLYIKEGWVDYEEQVPDQDSLGRFSLGQIDATLTGITNDPEHIRQDHAIQAQVSARIMDEANMRARIRMPYRKDGYHVFEGLVGEMDARQLNAILVPAGSVQINSGRIHALNFSFEADTAMSQGKMEFFYNDLNIRLLSRSTRSGLHIGETFSSLMANTFFIQSNNPNGKKVRVGEISHEREKNKGVIVYWIKSVIEGLKSSVGLKKAEKIK